MMDPWLEETDVAVCFTGHRFISASLVPEIRFRLDKAIAGALEKGFTRFICGGALGFDTIAAQQVLSFRKDHPEVRLLIAIPCEDQDATWNADEREIYRSILEKADGSVVLAEKYTPGCMQNRNRFMVDHSSLCITWLTKLNRSGTLSTVRYAYSRDIPVINLAVED